MRVGILGPLEVVADGEIVEVGGARLRTLLIRLALDAGRTVTADLLSHALWPEEGPTDRANALQSLVSRLRQTLPGTPVVRSVPGGYRLELPPESVDALRFERLAREGRRELRDRQAGIAVRRLREALGLWRGEALADVAEAPFAAAAVVRLSELRLGAIEDRIEAELQSAPEHSHLVAELEELAALHPPAGTAAGPPRQSAPRRREAGRGPHRLRGVSQAAGRRAWRGSWAGAAGRAPHRPSG